LLKAHNVNSVELAMVSRESTQAHMSCGIIGKAENHVA
jgi:hypothetical protein